MAPDAGFEPATKWLTVTYSTAELIRNIIKKISIQVVDSERFELSEGLPLRILSRDVVSAAHPAIHVLKKRTWLYLGGSNMYLKN